MKHINIFAISLLAAVLLIACTTSLLAPTHEIPTQSTTGVQTETPMPIATTEVDTPGATQVLEGPEISYKGIHFFLDPAMGSRLYVFDDVITLDGLTGHSTRFALTSEAYCITWCLEIYPISEFEQSFGFFVFPPAGYRGGAAVIFKAQEKALSFQDGSGNRALEAFGQNHYGISNESLKYVFRGYRADKHYGLFGQVPIHDPGLPDAAPTMTSGSDPVKDIGEYNRHAAEAMNALSPADFTPNLDLLDALAMSIHVETY
jgi:hypothetical protein